MLRLVLLTSMVTLSLGSPLAAAPLLVDFNDRSGSQPTQAGYVGVTQNGATGIATDFGTIDIAFSKIAGISIDDRDRGALDASQPLSDLLRDFVYISETTDGASGDGTLDLILTGLEAGTYKFTGYFHDRAVDHVAGDVAVSVDGGVNFDSVLDNVLFSAGVNPSEVGMGMFHFSANGADPVHVRIVGQEGLYNLSTGAFTDQNSALISGFDLQRVPEPGTLVGVAALAMLVVAGRRRK